MTFIVHRFNCLDCGQPLPPGGAGKCARCAGGKGVAGLPIAPHCEKCGTALVYDPKGPMAVYNPRCRCDQ